MASPVTVSWRRKFCCCGKRPVQCLAISTYLGYVHSWQRCPWSEVAHASRLPCFIVLQPSLIHSRGERVLSWTCSPSSGYAAWAEPDCLGRDLVWTMSSRWPWQSLSPCSQAAKWCGVHLGGRSKQRRWVTRSWLYTTGVLECQTEDAIRRESRRRKNPAGGG